MTLRAAGATITDHGVSLEGWLQTYLRIKVYSAIGNEAGRTIAISETGGHSGLAVSVHARTPKLRPSVSRNVFPVVSVFLVPKLTVSATGLHRMQRERAWLVRRARSPTQRPPKSWGIVANPLTRIISGKKFDPARATVSNAHHALRS
jgi:hypothetical protein